jgi:hypothetical protein
MDTSSLLDLVSSAVEQVAHAQRRRRWEQFHLARALMRKYARAMPRDPGLDAALPSIMTAHPAPPPPGDSSALGRLLVDLHAQRVPSHTVARALIKTGYCRGPHAPKNIQCCEARMRKVRSRYRLRRLSEHGRVTSPR